MKIYQGIMAASKGRLVIRDEVAYRRFTSALEDGTEWQVTIKRKPQRQGNQAMRYYRGVVIPDIATACGYPDPDDFESVHESLAWKFLRIEDHPQLKYPRRRSTAKNHMSADEMTDYITKCIEWAENPETGIPGCRVRRANEVDMDDLPMVWTPADESEAA